LTDENNETADVNNQTSKPGKPQHLLPGVQPLYQETVGHTRPSHARSLELQTT